MQARRHQYLNAMGIQTWHLRDSLPAAKPVIELEPAIASALVDQSSQVESVPLDNGVHREEISTTPESVVADDQSPTQPENPQSQAPLKQEETEPVTSAAAIEPNPEFRFASIIFPGSCMVVAQVPTQGADPLTPQHLTFLKNGLLAVGANLNDEPVVTFFNWPMLRSPGFDQGHSAARQASQAFLSGQKSKHAVSFVLLMGENAGRYLLSDFVSFSESQGRLVSETEPPRLLSHAIDDLFAEPALKAAFWHDIQPLRRCQD